jgi:hypothetical protein
MSFFRQFDGLPFAGLVTRTGAVPAAAADRRRM